jgi:hypothetical protein
MKKLKEEFELVNCKSFSKEQVKLCISSATLRYKNLLIPAEMMTEIIKRKMIVYASDILSTRSDKEHKDRNMARAAILYQIFQKLAEVCDFDPIEELLRGRSCERMSDWRFFLDPQLLQDYLDYVPGHKDEVSRLYSNSMPSEWIPVLGVEVPKSLLREAAETQSNNWIERCNNIATDAEAEGYPQPNFLHKLRCKSILCDMLVTLLDGGDVSKNSPSGCDEAWTEEDWQEAYKLVIIKEEDS